MNAPIVIGGSVPGTRHTLPGSPGWKNNQDAFAWQYRPDDDVLVAVVCDGCSAGEKSEVGAELTAKYVLQSVFAELDNDDPENRDGFSWDSVLYAVGAKLDYLAEDLLNNGSQDDLSKELTKIIEQYFLSTIVGVLITPEEITIFSMGDGVFAVDGEFQTLGPFPDNKPPYPMLATKKLREYNYMVSKFRVQTFTDPSIQTILIGSDGVLDMIEAHAANACYPGTDKPVGDISRLFAPEFFSNPDNLRRHLALMNRETVRNGKIVAGLLPDDTTAILIHRSSRVEITTASQT
jgi:hypothetical protein